MSTDSAAQSPMRIVRDAFVVLDYALYDEDGDVIEATDEEGGRPIGFVFGYGTLVPGLEAQLLGMAAGETREIEVPPAEGYGERDEEREFRVDRAELPDDVAVDDELEAVGEDGEDVVMRVVEVEEDAVLVDLNHPLAGETLRFDVIVRAVRPATAEELAQTRAHAPRPRLAVVDANEPSPTPEHALQPPLSDAGEGGEVRTGRRAGKLTDDEQ